MFKNRNKKIINKVVKKILKSQKIKNAVTIIAITISAMLFTSLIALTDGVVKSQTLMMQMQTGSKADAEVKGLTKKQYERLVKSPLVKEAGMRRPIGFLSNARHHNIELDYLDEKAQNLFFSSPTHGVPPERANEVAASDRALRELGAKLKVGENVKITFKLRGNSREYSYDMTVSGWWEATDEQSSLMLVSDKFMDINESLFEKNRTCDFELGRYSAAMVLKHTKDAEAGLREAVQMVGGDPKNQSSENFTPIVINRSTSAELKEIMIPAGFIMILFILCSYLLIYNIFDIAVAKDIRTYGLLATIGASPSQIKKIVFRQGSYMAVIGIPAGLLAGYLVAEKLLPVIMGGMIEEDYSNIPVEGSTDPVFFVISTVITLFTIFISVYRPAKLAAGYNDAEAAVYSEKNRVKKYHLFKIKICQMAYENFTRNKKRAVLIAVSLSICIIFFNSVFIVSSSMDTEKFVSINMKTDYIAANADAFNLDKGYVYRDDGMTKDYVLFLNNLRGISDLGYLYKNTKDDSNVSFDYGADIEKTESYTDDEGILEDYGVINKDGISLGAPLADDGRCRCNVYGTDQVMSGRFRYSETLDKMTWDEVQKKFLGGDYIMEGAMIAPDNPTEVSEIPGYHCRVGQKVTAYKNGRKFKTYIVIAHIPVIQAEVEANDGANGATRVGQDAPKFYLPFSGFQELYDNPTLLNCTFNAKTEHAKKTINRKLEQYVKDNPSMGFYSAEKLVKSVSREQQKLFVVGGVMAGVLGIVGIINFINLITMSVISRKSDFAIMESIGMTQKQVIRMVVCEGIFYAVFTGILGLALSWVVGETVVKKILSLTWYYTFRMSLLPGIIIWAGMLVVVILSSGTAVKIFNREELPERLSGGE